MGRILNVSAASSRTAGSAATFCAAIVRAYVLARSLALCCENSDNDNDNDNEAGVGLTLLPPLTWKEALLCWTARWPLAVRAARMRPSRDCR